MVIALVQANIDQDLKFEAAYLRSSLALYGELSAPLWEGDLVIWPPIRAPSLTVASVPLE